MSLQLTPPTRTHTRIHHLFDERVAQAPDHPFLYLTQGVMTLGQLAQQVDLLEAELRQAGVRVGDRVLVAAENCPEHVALVLACSRVGAWACGVNARVTVSELAGFADKADARVLYFTVGVSEAARQHAAQHDTQASVLPGLQRAAVRPQATAQSFECKLSSSASPECGGDSVASSLKEVSSQSSTRTHAARTHTRREVGTCIYGIYRRRWAV